MLAHPHIPTELHPESWEDVSSCARRMGSAGCEVAGTKSIGIISVEKHNSSSRAQWWSSCYRRGEGNPLRFGNKAKGAGLDLSSCNQPMCWPTTILIPSSWRCQPLEYPVLLLFDTTSSSEDDVLGFSGLMPAHGNKLRESWREAWDKGLERWDKGEWL